MAVDPVPWFIGGGAEHSPEVARLLAYAAFGGAEGVIGANDLAVRPLAVPGAGVRVISGACAILNRAAGGSYQAYAGRVPTEEIVPVAATGSGSGRSDLIVMRVEDPYMPGEPWQDPADPTIGPYLFPRPIAGVPSTTRTVAELGLGYSAIALARIDFPPSTGTVTGPMIVDLRKIVNPRRERRVIGSSPSAPQSVSSNAWQDWPTAAVKTVDVPAWATQVKMITTVAGALIWQDKTNGYTRNRLGATTFGQATRFDTQGAVGGDALDKLLMTADTFTVPSAMRGTTQQVALQAQVDYRGPSGTGYLQSNEGTTVVMDLEFVEVPE